MYIDLWLSLELLARIAISPVAAPTTTSTTTVTTKATTTTKVPRPLYR